MDSKVRLINPFIWDECPACGYALFIYSIDRDKGIRECSRCDFIGKLKKKISN